MVPAEAGENVAVLGKRYSAIPANDHCQKAKYGGVSSHDPGVWSGSAGRIAVDRCFKVVNGRLSGMGIAISNC